jgi:glycosyltransferase involved in cell wall biosynthesis
VKFSIVTASYNQGRFIRDCIESVRTQTGVEWEHLVQDACSTDETAAVISGYPHLNCVTEKDGGMSDGINRGFRRATGDWVMWLNTDDYLAPDALQKVALFAQQHPDADIIYGDVDFVDGQKRFLRQRREHDFDAGVLLFYGCYIQSTATFIRRRVIEAGQLLDVNYRVCMDFEYYLRLTRAGFKFAHIPEILAAFRWHETNTSATQLARRREERLRAQREHLTLTRRARLLQNERVLGLLYRVYQMKRVLLRRG